MLAASDLFNENFYQATNPDVAAAITNGIFQSGFEHFQKFGQFERRNPSAFFDSAFYLQQNQDVANAVTANSTTAFDHFITFGQSERRNPNSLFDTNSYLANNSDVATAVQRDVLTGIEHYVKFGAKEGRNPSRFFDNNFYLNRNLDVAQAVQKDVITGIEHYIEFGQFEGRIPRNLFSQMFVFGDSISDVGTLFSLTGGILPPAPPYFNGRFSNGPVWVEDLAPRLGLTFNPSTDFAVGGATTGSQNVGSISNFILPGLQTEVDNFVTANQAGADPNALYVVWAGANDYLGSGSTDFATTVNNLATAVTKLTAVGAKNFMLPNQINLGATPAAISNGSQVQQGLSQLVVAHNTTLATAIQTLEQNPNINIIPVDVYSLLNNAIANPSNFGFTNVTTNLVPGAGTSPEVRGFTLPSGINPNEYLFWDALHPTTRAHSLIADTAVKATTAISEVVRIF